VFTVIKINENSRLSDFAKANIDALASSEIIVGSPCAYDPTEYCITLGERIDGYLNATR